MADVVACPEIGLDNDPARFLNRVDRHCIPYTTPELILFAGGCLMWVVAYALLIRNMRRDRFCEMAPLAGCSNFAWEFLWAFFFFTDMGRFLVWTYRAWFFLDIFIFWQLLKLGPSHVVNPALRRLFKPLCLVAVAGFGLAYYFFTKEGHDTLIGANSAYIAQMFISGGCLLMLIQAPTLAGYSWPIAWLRSVGTGMNTVFMLLHYRDNHFLHVLALSSLALDAWYCGLYLKRRRLSAARSALSMPRPG